MAFGEAGDTIGGIKIRIGADLSEMRRVASQVETALRPVRDRLQSIGAGFSAFVTAPLTLAAGIAVRASARFEQMASGLEAVMGSAEAAAEEMTLLRKAAESPGLGLEQAVRGSLALQSVGFRAAQARDILYEMGNAIAISGGSADDLAEVTRQLAQMQSLGKLTAENWNVIAERVPIAGRALQSAFGTTSIEAIRGTGIATEEFITRLVGGLSELERARGGLANALENLGVTVSDSFRRIGDALNRNFNLQRNLERLTVLLDRIVTGFENLSPAAQKTIFVFTGLLAAIGPVAAALAGLAAIAPAVAAGWALITGPVGLVVAGLGAVAVGAVYLYTQWGRVWPQIQLIATGALQGVVKSLETTARVLGFLRIIPKSAVDGVVEAAGRISGALAETQLALMAQIGTAEETAGVFDELKRSIEGAGGAVNGPASPVSPEVVRRMEKMQALARGFGGLAVRGAIVFGATAEDVYKMDAATGQWVKTTRFVRPELQATADMLRTTVRPAMEEAAEAGSLWALSLAELGEAGRGLAATFAESVGQGVGAVFGSLIEQARSFRGVVYSLGDVFKRVAAQMLAQVTALVVKFAALSALSAIFGFAGPGRFTSFVAGGLGIMGSARPAGPMPQPALSLAGGAVGGGMQRHVVQVRLEGRDLIGALEIGADTLRRGGYNVGG